MSTEPKSRWSSIVCAIGGIISYFLCAFLFSFLDLSPFWGLSISFSTIVIFAYGFRSTGKQLIVEQVPMTMRLILFRVGLATAFIMMITSLADQVGPQWSGLLTGFPMTLLPFLLIVHHSYPASYVRGIIRNLPLGFGSILVFLIIVQFLIPLMGSMAAISISLAGSIAYLFVLRLIFKPETADTAT